MDNVIHTYLVPTTAGVDYVVASNDIDQRRHLLVCLLAGDASRPAPLQHLARKTGMADRKALGALLFEMQREGWISGDLEPMKQIDDPLCQILEGRLQSLSPEGKGVLSDRLGCCIASVGYERKEANRLAAFGAGLYRISRRLQSDVTGAEPGWAITAGTPRSGFCIRHLHIGSRVFHLVLAGGMRDAADSFVQLVAGLIRQTTGGPTDDKQ